MADLSIQGMPDDIYDDFKIICIRKQESIKDRVIGLLTEDVKKNKK